MHSSRMRTVRCSSHPGEGVSEQGGYVCPGGVCLGVSAQGGMSAQGGVCLGGVFPGGCLPGGCLLRGVSATPTPL